MKTIEITEVDTRGAIPRWGLKHTRFALELTPSGDGCAPVLRIEVPLTGYRAAVSFPEHLPPSADSHPSAWLCCRYERHPEDGGSTRLWFTVELGGLHATETATRDREVLEGFYYVNPKGQIVDLGSR